MLYQFNLSFSLSLLFMGFLLANLFGIITSTKNIVFIFISCIELINCFVYTQSINYSSLPLPMSRRLRLWRRESKVRWGKAKGQGTSSVSKDDKGTFLSTKQKNENTISLHPLHPVQGVKGVQGVRALSYVFTILNFLKIGFEFGFFIDAFKLGS